MHIDGSGEIVFATGFDNQLIGTGSFELGSGQTLRADAGMHGSISTTVTNHGTVLVNGAIDGGANLHNASGGRVTGNGELQVGGTFANDALLTAGPGLHGDLGLLKLINADVDNSSTAATLFEIAGAGGAGNRGATYDALSIDRTFGLAGSLLVDLLGGFRPTFDNEYFVAQAIGGFLGSVDDFENVSGGIGSFGFGRAAVSVRNDFLVLSNFEFNGASVPAPATQGLLGLGLAAMIMLRRRCRHRSTMSH